MKTGGLWDDFAWSVEAEGYRWQELRTGLLLVPKRPTKARHRVTSYHPFSRKFADLHARFADLDTTPEAVLEFANTYGPLGYPITTHTWGSTVTLVPPSAPFDSWSFAKDGDSRKNYLGDVGEYLVAPDLKIKGLDQTSWEAQIRQLSNFQRNRRELRSTPELAPALQGTVNQQLQKTVGVYVSRPSASSVFDLRIKPTSLLGAIWLQAAQALSEPVEFRACLECSGPIEISRSGARTDAMFCSDACKLKDYRQRISKARKMAQRGATPSSIAKTLRTTPATVRGWIR